MANYFGIDFGTTNSAVYSISSFNDIIEAEFPIGEDDKIPFPSYVAINKQTGEVMTGLDAKNSIQSDQDYEIFSSIKTIIGENTEWNIAGRNWTPVDIAAELFKVLKMKAQARANCELDQAVVAVPVGFSSEKKNNIRKAAKRAGIRVTMLVSEPTSAFCSRRAEMKKYHHIAVFDWGGGTLDVVVLRLEDNIVSELSAIGMPLAGNDIDRKLAERVCMNASRKIGIDFGFEDLSKRVQQRLLNRCEEAKCSLADVDIAKVSVGHLDHYGMMAETIDYDYFSLLIENEVERAVDCLLRALSEAGMNRKEIDCIICEGGSSRLRPLQSLLLKYFDRDQLLFPKRAMWDIAAGAAQISYKPGCYTLSKPIGIIQSNQKFYPLLKVGQRLPTEEKIVKFGVIDASKEARFVLTDGEDESSQTFVDDFPVKIRGFSDETLTVCCYVDADMVFRMKVYSNHTKDGVFRVWTYSNLKVSYEMDAPEAETGFDQSQEKLG